MRGMADWASIVRKATPRWQCSLRDLLTPAHVALYATLTTQVVPALPPWTPTPLPCNETTDSLYTRMSSAAEAILRCAGQPVTPDNMNAWGLRLVEYRDSQCQLQYICDNDMADTPVPQARWNRFVRWAEMHTIGVQIHGVVIGGVVLCDNYLCGKCMRCQQATHDMLHRKATREIVDGLTGDEEAVYASLLSAYVARVMSKASADLAVEEASMQMS